MKIRKQKAKGKPKTKKKNHSATPAASSQLDETRLLKRFGLGLAESFKNTPQGIGEEVVKQFGKLVESSEHEDPEIVKEVIQRIVYRVAEVLQTIEAKPANTELSEVVQEQMVGAARRFSDTAFDVLDRTPNEASKLMTLGLVKLIAGQCDKLKTASTENPQTFRWIAEQNVFWPSIRGLYDSYSDGFSETKETLNLGGELSINQKPKRAPDMDKAAYREVAQFLIHAPYAHDWPGLPQLSRDKKTMPAWKKRLLFYLEANKKRLLQSPDFGHIRMRHRVKTKASNDALVWDEIKKDCVQVLRSVARDKVSRN